MVFYSEQLNPDYRLGNQLFAYNLVRQIATAASVTWAHPVLRERRWFQEMDATEVAPIGREDSIRFTQADLLDRDPHSVVAQVAELDKAGRDVELVQPILGETFFKYSFVAPGDFVRMRRSYPSRFMRDPGAKRVAVHFRGQDFLAWDSRAVLDFTYYRNALEHCVADAGGDIASVWVFTDDPRLQAYRTFLAHLSARHSNIAVVRGRRIGAPLADLWRMSQCDYLISTPSTFSFWGGVLGKKKKIVQSREWMDQQTSEGVRFWVEMNASRLPFYSIWRKA